MDLKVSPYGWVVWESKDDELDHAYYLKIAEEQLGQLKKESLTISDTTAFAVGRRDVLILFRMHRVAGRMRR
jgi:hypothetical protein